MKRLCTIILFSLACHPAAAQVTDSLFQKAYGGTNNETGAGLYATQDGGFILAGSTQSYSSGLFGGDAYLIRTDSNGAILWTKVYGEPDTDEKTQAVIQTKDKGFLLLANYREIATQDDYMLLVRTDSSGELLWSRSLLGSGSAVHQTADDGFVIGGSTVQPSVGGSDLYLVKTDPNGLTNWARSYGTLADEYAVDLKIADNGYILAGNILSGSTASDILMLYLDFGGNILWEQTYGDTNENVAASVVENAGGGFTVLTNTRDLSTSDYQLNLLKLDANGTLNMVKSLGGNGTDIGYTLQKVAGSGFVMSGVSSSYKPYDLKTWLCLLDTAFNVSWSRTYNEHSSQQVPNRVVTTLSGGYGILGTVQYTGGMEDLLFIKTDGDGGTWCFDSLQVPPITAASWSSTSIALQWLDGSTAGFHQGLTDTGGIVYTICQNTTSIADEPSGISFDVYPNPAKDMVKFSGVFKTGSTIRIFSVDGRLADEVSADKPVVTVALRGVPAGAYYFQAQLNDGSFRTGKLIITGN